jgi:hypothetical protein
VLEIIEQTFFVHQAFSKGKIRFLILADQRMRWVDTTISDIVSPRRYELSLTLQAFKNAVEYLKNGFILEHSAVSAEPEKGRPRFDRCRIAREATIGADAFCRGNVAMKWPPIHGRVGGQEFN